MYIAELLRLSTHDQMQNLYYLLDMPSFSLGLSQEDAPNGPIEEAPEPRKSKRPRITPAVLQDYKCDPKVTVTLALIPDLEDRFKLMEETVLKGP